MVLIDYLKKLDQICKSDLMTAQELCSKLNIAHHTLIRARRYPEKCSMKTMRKIKSFVDKWEAKNINVSAKD